MTRRSIVGSRTRVKAASLRPQRVRASGDPTQAMRDAVALYVGHGFRVVPLFGVTSGGECLCGDPACPRIGKHEHPDIDGEYRNGRVFTAEDFGPTDNVAIAMGPWRSGRWLVALDVDGADDLGAFFPTLPETLTQKSPRGKHYVYTVPEYTPLGNYVDVFLTKHAGFALDLRYARGRINVAPSRGATGRYEWLDWRSPTPLPKRALQSILAERERRGLPVAERWERGDKDP